MRSRSILAPLAAILVSASVTLVALEIAARAYLAWFASEARFVNYASFTQLEERYASDSDASLNRILTPHRYLGYFPTPGYRRGDNLHNSLGYRGDEVPVPKPHGEVRIVCLGGSTTYDSDIDDWNRAYPAQLERILHERGYSYVRVINAGAMGWTSWETLINFEFRVLDLEPDVAIDLDALNDVHPRMVWPPDRYAGDNSGYRAANASGLFMPGILEYSTLARILMVRGGWVASHADISRTIDRLAATYYGDAWRDQKRGGRYPEGVFAETSGAEMLAANPPVYFERNVESLVAVARRQGVALVLASFPYSPEFPEEPRVTSSEYREAIAEHNRVLADVAVRTGTAFFDFAAVFPADRRYFTDGRHNNEAGARLKAAMFADFLARSGLLERRPAN